MSKPDNPSAPKKKRFMTALSAHISPVVGQALSSRGLSESSLISYWPEIVGLDIARFARFDRLNWPPRGAKTDPEAPRAPATLVLRIDGAFAIEAQHLTKLIVERVNAHLGWRCVAKVAFRQGPLPEAPKPRRVPPPSPQAMAEARGAAAAMEDPDLREALARLGARVIERRRG